MLSASDRTCPVAVESQYSINPYDSGVDWRNRVVKCGHGSNRHSHARLSSVCDLQPAAARSWRYRLASTRRSLPGMFGADAASARNRNRQTVTRTCAGAVVTPSRGQIPTDTSLLSDADLERIYALPPLTDEQADVIGRLLRGTATERTKPHNE